MRRTLEQPLDDPPLAVAKLGLAEPFEEFRDRAARGAFYLVVGIDEGEAEPVRQPFADCALAGTHQPD